MKTTETNDSLTRWLDGAMDATERSAFEAELQQNPALRDEAESLRRMGAFLKGGISLEKPVPHADFFNSQIQEQILREQRADERRSGAAKGPSTWFGWLRMPWAIGAAAAVLALGFYLISRHNDSDQTQVLSLYTPDPEVEATVKYHPDSGATVLTLDGLQAIPDDQSLSVLRARGMNVAGGTPDALEIRGVFVAAN